MQLLCCSAFNPTNTQKNTGGGGSSSRRIVVVVEVGERGGGGMKDRKKRERPKGRKDINQETNVQYVTVILILP